MTSLPGEDFLRSFEASEQWILATLMRFKKALAAEFGAEKGFAQYKLTVNLPDSDHVRLMRLGSVYEFAKKGPGALFEVAPAGEPFAVPPPTVIGEGNHRTINGHTRAMFVDCIIDARVRGRSALIKADDMVLHEYQGSELDRLDDQLDLDPAVFQATSDAVWLIEPTDEASSIELEEAFTLLGVHTWAFDHWIMEYLPKYIGAVLSGALPPVPVLIDAGMVKTHRQALELMLPEGVQIIELPTFARARVRRLWCAPSLMYWGLLANSDKPANLAYFTAPPMRSASIAREMVHRANRVALPATHSQRVFLARKPTLYRKLVNHSVIEAAAEARGFQVVYPEELDFIEQVRLLRHARLVIGPEGSALMLVLFARTGTRVCILNHPDVEGLLDLTGVLSEIGIHATVLTGPFVCQDDETLKFSDYEIEEDGFCRFLDRWLESEEP